MFGPSSYHLKRRTTSFGLLGSRSSRIPIAVGESGSSIPSNRFLHTDGPQQAFGGPHSRHTKHHPRAQTIHCVDSTSSPRDDTSTVAQWLRQSCHASPEFAASMRRVDPQRTKRPHREYLHREEDEPPPVQRIVFLLELRILRQRFDLSHRRIHSSTRMSAGYRPKVF